MKCEALAGVALILSALPPVAFALPSSSSTPGSVPVRSNATHEMDIAKRTLCEYRNSCSLVESSRPHKLRKESVVSLILVQGARRCRYRCTTVSTHPCTLVSSRKMRT